MAKQIITLELDMEKVYMDNMDCEDGFQDKNFLEILNYWFGNQIGYNFNSVKVLQSSPVQLTPAEIQAEINAG